MIQALHLQRYRGYQIDLIQASHLQRYRGYQIDMIQALHLQRYRGYQIDMIQASHLQRYRGYQIDMIQASHLQRYRGYQIDLILASRQLMNIYDPGQDINESFHLKVFDRPLSILYSNFLYILKKLGRFRHCQLFPKKMQNSKKGCIKSVL